MTQKNDDKITKLMLLIGAGASVVCGIPTGAALVKEIIGMSNKSKLKKFYIEIKKHYNKEAGHDPDFEDLLVFLDMMGQEQAKIMRSYITEIVPKENQKDIKGIQANITGLKNELLRNLRVVCMKIILNKSKNQYSAFFKLSDKIKLKIFTTNYDVVFESVLNDEDYENYSTNFYQKKRGKEYLNYWDESEASLKEAQIQIGKLHGSVTWYRDKKTKKIEDKGTLASLSSDKNPVDSMMITPTVFKDIYQKPYYTLYSIYQHELIMNNLLVVVGHSLRDEALYGAIVDYLDKGGKVLYVGKSKATETSKRIKTLNKMEGFVYFSGNSLTFFPQLSKAIIDGGYSVSKVLSSFKQKSESEKKRAASIKRTHKKKAKEKSEQIIELPPPQDS